MKIVIATRCSQLALWQTRHVKQALLNIRPDLDIQFLELNTQGDKIQNKPLSKIGGKGLFIKELEAALLDGRADLAVHSMKDVPNELGAGLVFPAILERADPCDAFVSVLYSSWKDLPCNASVGTCSVRRKAQLLALSPDLNIQDLRGNVDTRIRKLVNKEYDAVIMAAAGLKRLGLDAYIKEYFQLDYMLPSVSQGAIGVQCQADNQALIGLLQLINHRPSQICIEQERAFTKALSADCCSPVAVHAVLKGELIHLEGLVASLDGSSILRGQTTGTILENPGKKLAEQLLSQGADRILCL